VVNSYRWWIPLAVDTCGWWIPATFILETKRNWASFWKKIFSVKIGQNGYQNAQNFILIPNLKMKLRKMKSCIENTNKRAGFCEYRVPTFLVEFVFPSDLESVLNFAFLGRYRVPTYQNWPIWRKRFSAQLKKNIMQSILLYSMVLSRWGRRSTNA